MSAMLTRYQVRVCVPAMLMGLLGQGCVSAMLTRYQVRVCVPAMLIRLSVQGVSACYANEVIRSGGECLLCL